jgi:hypothetical protein
VSKSEAPPPNPTTVKPIGTIAVVMAPNANHSAASLTWARITNRDSGEPAEPKITARLPQRRASHKNTPAQARESARHLSTPMSARNPALTALNKQVCSYDYDPSDARCHARKQHKIDCDSHHFRPPLLHPAITPDCGTKVTLADKIAVPVDKPTFGPSAKINRASTWHRALLLTEGHTVRRRSGALDLRSARSHEHDPTVDAGAKRADIFDVVDHL